ncbi:MAG: N-acetylmuramoyl-L-alanine amidase [Candidatus Thiothrix putei]|uniref:N-acetylmuramoyl-L-alanine amidase AmiC n=1 Tax=Candidatus Thiothrix putei TaxID=3080811 RepID=A0AA95HHD5_9GAMM|nr:MAG: N-acetylmuramoyl-L-alanine amidase [Candidatus Thiothrix putei]
MNTKKLSRRGFLLKLSALAGAVASGFNTVSARAADAVTGHLTGANLSGTSEQLKFLLQLDAPIAHKVFTLDSPDRVVIDLQNTTMQGKLKQGAHDRKPITGIRYSERDNGSLRVVLDVAEQVTVKSSLTPDGANHLLTITLKPNGKGSTGKSPKPEKEKPKSAKEPETPATSEPSKGKFIVVIDPGHGGKDPGAVGANGTQEKDVVLQVARKLKAHIDREKGMKAILTRDSDKFIPLRERMDLAHKHKADLFISVHADANPSTRVSGSSVYILSETGASSEAARLLAESENSYELKFGGRSFNNTSEKIASVLLDLSQNAMMDRSLNLAKGVLRELSKVNNPLRRRVESARFVVLRSPDIPSMLVETAFISNPTEEKRLRTADYQQKLATAMFQGVKRYQIAYADSGRANT